MALPLEDVCLIDHLHGGFPLTDRPFADVARRLGTSEDSVMSRLTGLLARGVLTRFGPLYQIERAGGLFVLAAMQVPEARFDEVTAQVNALNEVAHNYRREHALNMWFVLAGETPEVVQSAIARIERETGLPVYAFPKEKEFFVELRLPLCAQATPPVGDATAAAGAGVAGGVGAGGRRRPSGHDPIRLDARDRHLLSATQAGLPVLSRPYEAVGAVLGEPGEWVRQRLGEMLDEGLVRRIGAVPNHYRLGFTANGMTVWDVDDARIDELGERIGALPGVSHCYRRPRRLPLWPYNLFAMLHGRSREEVEAQARVLRDLLGDACRGHDILYSSRILKKTGLRLKDD